MDLHVALAVFTALEASRIPDESRLEPGENPYEPPTHNVRLDAASDRNEERTYRIRVTSDPTPNAHREVIDLADVHGLSLRLENTAIELS